MAGPTHPDASNPPTPTPTPTGPKPGLDPNSTHPQENPDTDTLRATKNRPASQPGLGAAAPLTAIGRFEVRQLLGSGTFGTVYRASDPRAGRNVAIKIPNNANLSAEEKAGFLNEARAAAAIEHVHVCPVYEVNECDGVPYIVMPFVPMTLEAVLKKLKGKMDPRQALIIARRLAEGLQAAHEQDVIHRDLKPANVLYDPVKKNVLITDFGLAKFINHTALAASMNGAKGTPFYMPPEQWEPGGPGKPGRFGPVGIHSDIYSLGVILFEMLAGGPPFSGTPWAVMYDHCQTAPPRPSEVRAGLDPGLDAIVLKAMAKQPGDRYRSAKEFRNALTPFVKQPAAPPAKPVPPSPPPAPVVPPAPARVPPARPASPRGGSPPDDEFVLMDEPPPPKPGKKKPKKPQTLDDLDPMDFDDPPPTNPTSGV